MNEKVENHIENGVEKNENENKQNLKKTEEKIEEEKGEKTEIAEKETDETKKNLDNSLVWGPRRRKRERELFKKLGMQFLFWFKKINLVPVVLLFVSVFGGIVFYNVKIQEKENILLIRENLMENVHYIDLYETSKDSKYIYYLYGNLKSLDALLNQAAHMNLVYPKLFGGKLDDQTFRYVQESIDKLEKAIDKRELKTEELFELKNSFERMLKNSEREINFNAFLKKMGNATRNQEK